MPAAPHSPLPVLVILGPARSGKTHELVGRYGDALAGTPPGQTGRLLWLAPSARAAAAVRDELIDRGVEACLAPGVRTFDDLVRQIIADSKRKVRSVSAVGQRELLRRVLARALADPHPALSQRERVSSPGLKFFADAAGRSGFVDLVAEHIRELQRHDIRPDAYARIAAASRGREPHVELALLYSGYETLCAAHGLVDVEGRYVLARDLLGVGNLPPAARSLPAVAGLPPSPYDLIVVDGFTDFTQVQLELLALLARGSQQLIVSLPMEHSGATGSASALTAPDSTPSNKQSSRHLAPFSCATAGLSSSASPAPPLLNTPGVRSDLFAKTTATLAQLRERFPNLAVEHVATRACAVPALDHLTHNVFRHPHEDPAPDVLKSLGRVEIIEAASAQDEIAQIARRIKSRLTQGDKPGDILVVFRSLADPQRIEDVFDRYGIPYSLEAAPRIARAPAFNTLTSLLELDADNWPFRRLVSVVTNTSLGALTDESRQAAGWLVRDLQIVKGREKLLEQVTGLAAKQESAEQFSDQHRRRIRAAVAARFALTQLAAAFDRLPQEATATEWTAALARLGAELGMSPFAGWHALRLGEGRGEPGEGAPRPSRTQGVPPDELNSAAWNAIVSHFAALERLDQWLGESPRKLDRRGALALLIDVATKEALPRSFDEAGRVRILAAKTARAIAARHVYLAGMSEQAFPASARSGVLAGEADYRFFVRAAKQKEGTPSPQSPAPSPLTTHSQEEMLLFYEVLSRAEETLTISYPAMDDKAQELPPSPYVVDLKRMFRGCEKGIAIAKPQLSPIPPVGEFLRNSHQSPLPHEQSHHSSSPSVRVSEKLAYSVADWRLQSVAEAVGPDRDARLLAGLFSHAAAKPLADSIDAGIRIVHARARGEEFGAAEGLLRSPGVLVKLTERFGSKYPWSPSQLETYAACPFKFYLEDVLKLEPLGDLVLETDFARRGSLFHEVLAAFHRKYRDLPAGEWAALWADEARFAEELRNVLAATIGTTREGIDGALVELDRRQITQWTDHYHEQHEKYAKPWEKFDEAPQPAHFELRFGKKHVSESGDEDKDSTNVAFSLDIGGEKIQISGRIDRIDVGTAGGKTVFNVIDYKSGKRPTLSHDRIESGERLQPALYAMAAEALLFPGDGAVPLWAGYWSMQQGVNTQEKFSLHCSDSEGKLTKDWKTLRPKVIERIGQIVRGARKGDFPVASTDPHCTRTCEFRTVCRIAQVRSLNKVWIPETAEHQPEA